VKCVVNVEKKQCRFESLKMRHGLRIYFEQAGDGTQGGDIAYCFLTEREAPDAG